MREEIPLGEMDDLRYFEDKLSRTKHPAARVKIQKQIDMLKTCIESFKKHRQ